MWIEMAKDQKFVMRIIWNMNQITSSYKNGNVKNHNTWEDAFQVLSNKIIEIIPEIKYDLEIEVNIKKRRNLLLWEYDPTTKTVEQFSEWLDYCDPIREIINTQKDLEDNLRNLSERICKIREMIDSDL